MGILSFLQPKKTLVRVLDTNWVLMKEYSTYNVPQTDNLITIGDAHATYYVVVKTIFPSNDSDVATIIVDKYIG